MATEAPADHIGADIGGHDQETGQQGERQPGAPGPVGERQHAREVRRQAGIHQVAQLDPVAGQETEVKESEHGGGDVGDRAGGGLQQQPAADHRPRSRQNRRRHIAGHPGRCTAGTHPVGRRRRLGGEQQQLHGHQGGLGGGPDALELGHAEKLQQPQMHDQAHRQGEPPAAEQHHQSAETTRRPATGQTGNRGGGAGGGQGQRSAAITNSGSAAASLAWLPRRCMRCTVA